MSDLLDDMTALGETARRCIPRLSADPVLKKSEFNTKAILLLDLEFHQITGHKVVVLEPCGPLSYYIAQILRELLAEEGIDAWVNFHY